MSRPQVIPALTSLRGIAAWWVVLYPFSRIPAVALAGMADWH